MLVNWVSLIQLLLKTFKQLLESDWYLNLTMNLALVRSRRAVADLPGFFANNLLTPKNLVKRS
jgi:hypothetical protein